MVRLAFRTQEPRGALVHVVFFASRRRHTRFDCDWSSDVCSSDLKTTALRCIAGLEEPSSGEVLIGGRDVTRLDPAARDVAMVFQTYALYPPLTVRGNVAFGLEVRRVPAAEIARRVQQVADRLGLGPLLERRPAELSGGERQRVALGRALVREPQGFLFDEPLSNLEPTLPEIGR